MYQSSPVRPVAYAVLPSGGCCPTGGLAIQVGSINIYACNPTAAKPAEMVSRLQSTPPSRVTKPPYISSLCYTRPSRPGDGGSFTLNFGNAPAKTQVQISMVPVSTARPNPHISPIMPTTTLGSVSVATTVSIPYYPSVPTDIPPVQSVTATFKSPDGTVHSSTVDIQLLKNTGKLSSC